MAADASSAAGAPVTAGRPRDGLWLLTLWIVLSIIGCLLVALVWGPHLPPGAASNTAASQQTDITVLATIATPVVIGVLLYIGWALAFWRQKPGDETDAAPIHGNTRITALWITVTSVIVLALAVYGTVELIAPAGAGAGQGPQPIFQRGMPPATSDTSWAPGTNNILQVQVIGQQWAWTFRYPQFGGFETTDLLIPLNTPVRFNVTFTVPKQAGQFVVRCAELCGIWHGAMYDYGKVVPVAAFMTWAHATEIQLAALTKILPPYALTYDPTVIANVGKVNEELGLTSAGGGYYNPADPEQP